MRQKCTMACARSRLTINSCIGASNKSLCPPVACHAWGYSEVLVAQSDCACWLQAPMLLLWGVLDPWIGSGSADRIQSLYPSADRIELQAGHCPQARHEVSVLSQAADVQDLTASVACRMTCLQSSTRRSSSGWTPCRDDMACVSAVAGVPGRLPVLSTSQLSGDCVNKSAVWGLCHLLVARWCMAHALC